MWVLIRTTLTSANLGLHPDITRKGILTAINILQNLDGGSVDVIAMVSGSPTPGAHLDRVPRQEVKLEQGSGSHDDLLRDASSASSAGAIVQSVTQLPSPSPSRTPSPAPGSLSSSLLTDGSTETDHLPLIPRGHNYSGSFEKAIYTKSISTEDDGVVASPLPISKTLPPHELHDIAEEKVRQPRKLSGSNANGEIMKSPRIQVETVTDVMEHKIRRPSVNKLTGEVLKLTAAEVEELTSAPESLPVASPTRLTVSAQPSLATSPVFDGRGSLSDGPYSDTETRRGKHRKISAPEPMDILAESPNDGRMRADTTSSTTTRRPTYSSRAVSTPPTSSKYSSSNGKPQHHQLSPKRKLMQWGLRPEPLDLGQVSAKLQNAGTKAEPDGSSPMPQSIPIPPMSIPTYLQLELSSTRPSPLYIYRPASSEFPYESSEVKFERLLNFLILPPQLEQVLYFGSMACLDAWLYTFTILPLRFFKALAILIQWWGQVVAKEAAFISGFIYHGSGRFWHRQRGGSDSTDSPTRSRSVSRARRPAASTSVSYQFQAGRRPDTTSPTLNAEHLKAELERKSRPRWGRRHRRTKSQPSSLSSYHKADLLQGAVIACSCMILMKLDASRMYHSIRGQSAIKLYVIFNALEVGNFAWLIIRC